MPRDYKIYLEDISEAIGKILKYTEKMSAEEFGKDAKTVDAVIRNLEIMGEAIKKVPDEIRAKDPAIDWRRISGLRDILIHEYFGIDDQIVWDIIQNKLPVLKKQVKALLDG